MSCVAESETKSLDANIMYINPSVINLCLKYAMYTLNIILALIGLIIIFSCHYGVMITFLNEGKLIGMVFLDLHSLLGQILKFAWYNTVRIIRTENE